MYISQLHVYNTNNNFWLASYVYFLTTSLYYILTDGEHDNGLVNEDGTGQMLRDVHMSWVTKLNVPYKVTVLVTIPEGGHVTHGSQI